MLKLTRRNQEIFKGVLNEGLHQFKFHIISPNPQDTVGSGVFIANIVNNESINKSNYDWRNSDNLGLFKYFPKGENEIIVTVEVAIIKQEHDFSISGRLWRSNDNISITLLEHVCSTNIDKDVVKNITQHEKLGLQFDYKEFFSNHIDKFQGNDLDLLLHRMSHFESLSYGIDKLSMIAKTKNIELKKYINSAKHLPVLGKSKKQLKVAVCISGQMRDYKSCASSLLDELIRPLNADVYIHTWKNSGIKSTGLENISHAKRVLPISLLEQLNITKCQSPDDFDMHMQLITEYISGLKVDVDYNEVHSLFNPIELIIEDEKIFEDIYCDSSESSQHINLKKMLYKISAANTIKSKHEYGAGFIYDLVIRVRPDLLILDKLKFDAQSIYNMCRNDSIILEVYDGENRIASDQFAVGSSYAMNSYSSLFEKLDLYKQNFKHIRHGGAHAILFDHLFSSGLKVKQERLFSRKYSDNIVSDSSLITLIKNSAIYDIYKYRYLEALEPALT